MQKFAFKNNQPIDLLQVTIPGERITLVPVNEHFAEDIFVAFTAEITRYMMPKPADSIDDTLAFIRSASQGNKDATDLVLAITDSHSGEFYGCCGFHVRGNTRAPELGIWLKKSAHGFGYGREAITMLVRWSLSWLDYDYALYPVDRANGPSRKIPESLGGELAGEARVETMRGTFLDEVIYQVPVETLESRLAQAVC